LWGGVLTILSPDNEETKQTQKKRKRKENNKVRNSDAAP
jgi:hypothetical protein